jgi:hypothetical protein
MKSNVSGKDLYRMQKMKSIFRKGIADMKFKRHNNLHKKEMYSVFQPGGDDFGNRSASMYPNLSA